MTPRQPAKSGRPTETVGQVKKDLLAVTIRLLNTSGRKGATARAICNEAGVGALGSVGFISTEREDTEPPDPSIHESVREAILTALFAKPARSVKAIRRVAVKKAG